MNIVAKLAEEFSLKKYQVENTIKLIDEGNTIPFIARYRKEQTGELSDVILRELNDRLTYLRNLESRKEEVIRLIDEQGKLTEELKKEILSATVLQRVEDLYRPYKKKKRTRGTKAKEKGLEPLAEIIMKQETTTGTIEEVAKPFINEEKEVLTVEDALQGAKDIIAEIISDNAEYRKRIRSVYFDKGIIQTKAVDEEEVTVYEMYYDYTEPVNKIANHRILAINRGEKEKKLRVKVVTPDEEIIEYLKGQVVENSQAITTEHLIEAIEDSYKRLIAPSIEREVRSTLTERAEEEAIKVFASNTKKLLMIPPVEDVRVLAIDPSYRTGCKLAVLDDTGKLLDYTTIYPNEPQNEVEKSKETMKELIEKYDIDMISIGNGTASRETELIVADMLKEIDKEVYYTIVSEAGASVYSASKLAAEEYPDVNVSIRGAISIGRRLQDPLAELVKIDPKSIGVGQYQHDLNQKRLGEALNGVVEDCVNSVGVDLNTATPSLLHYVSGITPSIAKNIVAYREENGKFTNRNQLKEVKRLGDKSFEQCAGFLRIRDGENLLDNTAVHPESYDITMKLIEKLGFTKEDIRQGKLKNIEQRILEYEIEEDREEAVDNSFNKTLKSLEELSKVKIGHNKKNRKVSRTEKLEKRIAKLSEQLEVGVPTLRDIIQELKKPGRDPREEMPKPIFRSDVLKMEDLRPNMVLTGTVRNVVDFGAFVDIGVKQDGLVHISEMSDRFVKNPMDIVSVGDIVNVRIIDLDIERGRISLSMKQV
ncbi:Tex family protein [Caldisalinibacter kiritimatiensis]|uniref:Transcription accessory protein (S1 RNA-binding domain) n=1 Tax=Caldisalinibacter kiritimatiensis TaxID=1304284 RepID=R1CUR3_9FIRM|nr:Tex family protein [Caldisalinibacter kiritimatiensis]EOD00399.1 Transcription accessory protein (S1 RNA-binding domain) [Caldisalinibacter kiritimatiensis]